MEKGRDNIVLIGMPGAGKSTVGVLLAKALSRAFVDTDLLIQQAEGRRLGEIIAAEGMDAFVEIEQRAVLGLSCRETVIATGGSVVYSAAAMEHLREGGLVVWLDLPLAEIEKRVRDTTGRGVVMRPGDSLAEVYERRRGLYEKYAAVRVACGGMGHEQVVAAVLQACGV